MKYEAVKTEKGYGIRIKIAADIVTVPDITDSWRRAQIFAMRLNQYDGTSSENLLASKT